MLLGSALREKLQQYAPVAKRRPLRAVHQAGEAMQWAEHGLERILDHNIMDAESLAIALSDRTITTSNAFSGIAADDIADKVIHAAAAGIVQDTGSDRQPVQFVPSWSLEKDQKCQEELLHEAVCPKHVFGDIMKCVPHYVHSQSSSPEQVRLQFMNSPVAKKMWCVKCGKQCMAESTHWHTAGSPCVDHTTFGLCQGEAGPAWRLF